MKNESSNKKVKTTYPFAPLNSRFSNSSGFTIIEILVVFTIIVILSSVGLASFSTYSRTQTVTQAAANLKQTIDLARFNAKSSVKPDTCDMQDLSAYKVNFCNNVSCYSGLVDYEMTVDCGGEIVVEIGSLPDNLVFDNVSSGNNCTTLVYNVVSGIVNNAPCDVKIVGYGNEIVLSVAPNGTVSY